MKKQINLIALVMLVSTNVLTPFSYAKANGGSSCDYILYNKCYNVGEGTRYSDIISPSDYGTWYVNGEEFEDFDDEIRKDKNVEIYFKRNDGISDNDRIIYGYDENQKPIITIYDENFEYGVTISAVNEGTNTPGYGEGSFGKYFQRGNNHGQSNNPTIGSAMAEWDESYSNHGYDGPISDFITIKNENKDYWLDGTLHDDLWGGENDGQENDSSIVWGYDTVNHIVTNVEGRQGPCQDGYHVPSGGEWNELVKLRSLALNKCDNLPVYIECPIELSNISLPWIDYSYIGAIDFGNYFSKLLLPKAGELYIDAEGDYAFTQIGYNFNYGCQGSYWTSSPMRINNMGKPTGIGFGVYCAPYGISDRIDAGSIRCFKNEYSQIYEIKFSDMGNIIDVQNIMEGNKVTQPRELERNGYAFVGWYKDDKFTQEWNFDEDIVSGNMTLYAKRQECEEGYEVVKNQCVVEGSVGVKYKTGLIKISDGKDSVYLKDRNEGNIDDEMVDDYRFILNVEVIAGGILDDEFEEQCDYDEECVKEKALEYIEKKSGKHFDSEERLMEYIETLNEKYEGGLDNLLDEMVGNFYFRGNNTGVSWNELVIENGEIMNKSDLVKKGFDGGKIGNIDGSGWIEGNNNNPCDWSKGEYLPTPDDWKNLFGVRGNLNDYNMEEFPFILYDDVNFNGFSGSFIYAILADIIMYPGPYIFYENRMGLSNPGFLISWNGQNKDGEVGITLIDENLLGTAHANPENVDEDLVDEVNSVAMPVRCFVKVPVVKFEVNGGSPIDDMEVFKGDKIVIKNQPTKLNATFDGWYKDEELTEKWDIENDLVEDDMTLYAKWIENKPSGDSGGGRGGGGGSSKPDTPKDEQKSDETPEQTSQDDKNTENVIQSETEGSEESSNTPMDSSTSSQNNGKTYTQEFQKAYEFARQNGITTMPTIQKAQMNSKLTRIQMAKMLSKYALNVLGKQPDISKGTTNFNDVTNKMDRDYDNGVTLAYQLGIMGINMPNNNFRPNDEVTRAEFVAAFSRMLYGTSDGEYKSTSKYYTHHMEKLKSEGIVTNTNPSMKELRGYVMIMLMRSAQ